MGALEKMECCKAAGMDDIVVEMLKSGGISIIYRLLRIFNRYMESGVVPKILRQRVSSRSIEKNVKIIYE